MQVSHIILHYAIEYKLYTKSYYVTQITKTTAAMLVYLASKKKIYFSKETPTLLL